MSKTRNRILPALLTAGIAVAMTTAAQSRQGQPKLGPEILRHVQADVDKLKAGVHVGDTLDPKRLHPVSRPGLYGIGHVPSGANYGVIDGLLVRYDPESRKVLSIVRAVDAVLD